LVVRFQKKQGTANAHIPLGAIQASIGTAPNTSNQQNSFVRQKNSLLFLKDFCQNVKRRGKLLSVYIAMAMDFAFCLVTQIVMVAFIATAPERK
jgi:hypothetical protein